MFEFMRTEAGLDAFLYTVPGMGPVLNLIQTVRECDHTRTNLKRVVCLVELHRAHYVNLEWVVPTTLCAPLSIQQTRIYFAALQEPTDAFMWGTLRCTAYLSKASKLFGVFTSKLTTPAHDVAKHIVEAYKVGKLRGFDTEFAKRLIRQSRVREEEVDDPLLRAVRRKRVLGYSAVSGEGGQTTLKWKDDSSSNEKRQRI